MGGLSEDGRLVEFSEVMSRLFSTVAGEGVELSSFLVVAGGMSGGRRGLPEV